MRTLVILLRWFAVYDVMNCTPVWETVRFFAIRQWLLFGLPAAKRSFFLIVNQFVFAEMRHANRLTDWLMDWLVERECHSYSAFMTSVW